MEMNNMSFKKGDEIVGKMTTVFGVTEANSKEKKGKIWIISVEKILDVAAKKAMITVYDDPEFTGEVTTFVPSVVMNHIEKNEAALVGTGIKFVVEYAGMIPFKDGKTKYGRKTYHLFKFFEAVEDKGKSK
jgi:hypothetical protein